MGTRVPGGVIVDVLRGVVSRSSRSAEISGNQHGFSTGQILTCCVGGRPVEIWMEKVPIIHDGDEVVVAGKMKQGTLIARAYRNLSNGSYGRWGYELGKLFTILVFMVVGCGVCVGSSLAAAASDNDPMLK